MSKFFPVEISARHVHLNTRALEILFGKGHVLINKKNLSQPGQFVCEEKVEVVGPRRSIKNVSVLGPEREQVQVELSATDARNIGVTAPIRESSDLNNSVGCVLVGPKGQLTLTKGVIIAKRHIHATPNDAASLGVKHGDNVWVSIPSEQRNVVLGDVVVRVSPKYVLSMHIDTDEANAAQCQQGSKGTIVDINKLHTP